MKHLITLFGFAVIIVGTFAFFATILALPTMLLWNAVVPDITQGALTRLSFWQALGLNFLCGILFKSSSTSSEKKKS